jgi:hypothetical protein
LHHDDRLCEGARTSNKETQMKTSTLLTSLTASAAILVGAAACGSTKAAEKTAATAATDAAKTAAAHCGADKGPHEGSCAPGATPPAGDAAAKPADGAAPAPK